MIVFLIISTLSIAQQSIELTFSGHYYGNYIGLDSLLVKNISRDCDTVIYSPDTTLVLFYTVGIPEKTKNTFSISQNYPNPAIHGNTSFDVFMPESGQIRMQLFNIYGNAVLDYSNNMTQGKYTFDILNLNQNTYMLTASVTGSSKSIKMMSFGNKSKGVPELIQRSYSNISSNLKTDYAFTPFEFEQGDTLWYIGYSITPGMITGSDVIESIPQSDTTIIFDIIEGIPCQGTEAVKYDGHLYPTVQIDEQCWLKENINIGLMINGDTNMTNNGVIEKYCYNNEPENCEIYGGLYQWDELMQYTTQDESQGICPPEWHVASDNDFNELTLNHSGSDLKETGTSHWSTGNYGTNSTGFTALPAGYRGYNSGVFEMLREGADFYLSTVYLPNPETVWYRSLYYASSWVVGGNVWKTHGDSVRCVKD
ncbi:MAG: FISUMP domain-containing protein [Bacteroidales bacterium]|nr:FISUMP domain-containing protein [Bacteroidales bacterium]